MSLDAFARYPLLFGPSPVHRLERLTAHLGGAALWAKRDDCNSGLAYGGNKAAQAGVPRRRRARARLRHAGVDRRRAVQPHPAGRGRGRPHGHGLRARAGELGRLARRGLRPRGEHPAQPHHGRRRAAGEGRLRHRLQGELGAGARRRRGVRRQAVRDPRRRVGPPARRPGVRRLGTRAGVPRAAAGRVLRHDRRLLGHRQHPGGDDRRLRRPRARATRHRHRRVGAARRRGSRSPGSLVARRS